MPGDRLGHFELVEYVGGGGMGRVFRAIDTRMGRTVALKVLPPEQASDPDALQRFHNEAQSAARLDHDNIARAYYIGEDRGLHYIAFEFVEGLNVRRLVEERGPLPLADVISYTLQAADALAHADARAVVHRDIKPSNVLITPEGRVKLIDMGLARLRHPDPAVADLTASGVTLGTFDYISPEQARDPRNADIRSDIYSLGCTVFFMLVGQPPFPQGTVLQKLLQHQGDEPPDVRQFRPELPEEASRVLRKMMAKDPRHRYAGAADLVADLLLLAEQAGLRPMSPTSRIWLTPREPSVSFLRRHLPWMAPVAALVGIVLLSELTGRRDDLRPPPLEATGKGRAVVANVRSGRPAGPAVVNGSPSSPELKTIPPAAAKGKTLPPAANPPRDEPAVPPLKPAGDDGDVATSAGNSNRQAPELFPVGEPKGRGTAVSDPIPEEQGENVPWPEPADMAAESVAGRENVGGEVTEAEAEVGSPVGTAARDGNGPQGNPGSPASPPVRETAPAGEPPPGTSGRLIVSETASGENVYSSLGAACEAAHNGDVIELQFDGPREERPLKISNLQLTIRGGGDFRPVIVFRPGPGDPVKHPRSMFTLSAGRLTLSNLAVEFRVPRQVPFDNWSLFETWGGQTVRVERCSLTVSNASDQFAAYYEDVAFFRARPARDVETLVGSPPAATPLATIGLTDCIARGEAVFLRVEELQPVQLRWDNGLLVTTEQLLSTAGVQAVPKPDEVLHIDLQHVTAAVRGGLCRLTTTPANPFQLTVQFNCADSIFLGAPSVPLVEQEGPGGVENFHQRFIWTGDHNCYEDVGAFWTVRNAEFDVPPDVMNFDAWKKYWEPWRENQPSTERLTWKKRPDAGRPLHAHNPADYTLEDSATGGPGFRAARLPPLPPEAAPEKPGGPEPLHDATSERWHAQRG